MKTFLRFLVLVIVGASLSTCEVVEVSKGESDPGTLSQARNLGFEEGTAGDGDPTAWDRRGGEPENYMISIDSSTKRSGTSSALIRLNPDVGEAGNSDSSLIQCLEAESLVGKAFHLEGWIKTQEAQGEGAALWIGAYGPGDSSTGGWFPADDEWRSGSLDWSLYEAFTEPIPEETERICFGPILYGSGSTWFDDLAVRAE